MKKFYKLVLAGATLLLTVTALQARSLSPAEALSRLSENDQARKAVNSLGSAASPELKLTVSTPAGEPAVYLFTNPDNTMMVVGANDIATPLLAYGLTPGEGELPPQFQDWLKGYAADIASADSIIATGKVFPRKIKKTSRTDVIEPLMTTTWNQGNPYNYYCPEQDGNKSVTGCVATAFAQVLKYHEYPQKGKGEGHAWCNNEELTRSLEVTFRWDKMRDSYPGSTNPERATAVADLMVTCGFSVGMGYSPTGSGAASGNVPAALIENFSYDVTARAYGRDRFTLEDWKDRLITELSENGPVYYSGASNNGGHAFVCDGYNGKGYFHFNWGWGGYCDGYFKIDDLEPSGQGIGGYEGGYNLGQCAIFDVHKPRRGSKRPDNTLTQGDEFKVTIPEGRKIKIEGFWWNDYYQPREFTFAFELENIETNEKIYHTTLESYKLNGGYGCVAMEGELSEEYPDGTYLLHVVSRTGADKEWIRPPYNLSKTGSCYVTLRNGYPKVGMEAPEIKVLSATLHSAELKQNVEGSYSAEICNKFDYSQSIRIAVGLLDDTGALMASSGVKRLPLKPDQSQTYDHSFTINYDKSFEFNKEYEVVLFNSATKEIVHSFGNHMVLPEDTDGINAAEAYSEEINLRYDAATGRVAASSDAPIASVTVYNPAGVILNAPTDISGCNAGIDLTELEGVVIVTVADTTGVTATKKVVR